MSPSIALASAVREQSRRNAMGPIPRPQLGPQSTFWNTKADIAIYGGAAGAGKTYALLLEPTKHLSNPGFSSVFFRRETPQIRNPGGMWDESLPIYRRFHSKSASSVLEHNFPSGARVKFSHMEREDDRFSWDGAQVPLIGFDQLEHFTRVQFFYMLSRNRSACGVRPYVRATCNPNADSWLAEFISWWIDQESGYPIMERGGVLRWFVRDGETVVWGDTREELIENSDDEDCDPKSVTFIPGTVHDNRKLLDVDGGYLSNLKSLNLVERERLLSGNWKIRPAAGLLFRKEWCEVVDSIPEGCSFVRYWDRAGTQKTDANDPDWTVGIKMAKDPKTKTYYLVDSIRIRVSPAKVLEAMKNTASSDGIDCRVGFPQDPAQAGKDQATETIRALDGYSASSWIETGDKVIRFSPFSAQCEGGNVKILRGFSEESLRVLEGFPDGRFKDDADACSGAYQMFISAKGQAILDWMRAQTEEKQEKVDA